MLAAVVCSVLCGARSFAAIEQWIHLQEPEFWHALGFTRRPPTQNAWRNLLDALDPEIFEAVLARWIDAVWDGRNGSPVSGPASTDFIPTDSIDGKVLCGAIGVHGRALCLLTRVDQATGRVLSQTPVESKTNEHKAALGMLKDLVLKGELAGRLIVGDAAFCQKDIARTIDQAGGYYLLDVKDNQPTLKRYLELAFNGGRAFSPLPQAKAG